MQLRAFFSLKTKLQTYDRCSCFLKISIASRMINASDFFIYPRVISASKFCLPVSKQHLQSVKEFCGWWWLFSLNMKHRFIKKISRYV